jgi:hypothetical protein
MAAKVGADVGELRLTDHGDYYGINLQPALSQVTNRATMKSAVCLLLAVVVGCAVDAYVPSEWLQKQF